MIDRETRRVISIETASRLQSLANDPAVIAFFEAEERSQIEVMINAEPHDETGRRDAALMLKTMRKFRRFIAGKIGDGNRRAAQLANEIGA